jgi:cell division protein FtsW
MSALFADFNRHMQALRRDEVPGRFDPVIALGAAALAAFGLVMVASSSIAIASEMQAGPLHFALRHAVFLALGLAAAAVMMATPLQRLERVSRHLLLLAFLLLLALFVPGLGRRINGATRWLNLGVMGFQVVELVKLILVIYIASYLVRFSIQVRTSIFGVLKPLGITAMLVLLLLLQPDFGSAVLLSAIAVGMIWLGGARLRDLSGLALAGMPPMALAALAEPYRLQRLRSFLDPWADPFKDGFQLTQALIAIGRGEWLGVGLGGSVQKLFYLPEAHTDFIFAVIAEELGLIGVILVLALFGLLCGRIFALGLRATELGLRFGGYCAFGVALWIGFQVLVSVGVNLGVLPTKGLTLPLISSGGSSLILTCAAIGLALRVGYELSRREGEAKRLEGMAMPGLRA